MLQSSYCGLTTPIEVAEGAPIQLKYAPLRYCQSLFSFNGRSIRVVRELNDPYIKGLIAANELQKRDSHRVTLFFLALFKVVAIALLTLSVLGLAFVLIGAKIFSDNNPIIYERQVKSFTEAIQTLKEEERKSAFQEAEKKKKEIEEKHKAEIDKLNSVNQKLAEEQARSIAEILRLKQLEAEFTALKTQLAVPPIVHPSITSLSSNLIGASFSSSPTHIQGAGKEEMEKKSEAVSSSSMDQFLIENGGIKTGIATVIRNGQAVYKELRSDRPIKDIIAEWNAKSDEEMRRKLTTFMWFLLSKAMTKNQGFVEGAFSLPDTESRLTQFLKDIRVGCDRDSTHLKSHSTMVAGINIYDGSLPGGFCHILIQPIKGKNRLFLKPEAFGVMEQYTFSDLVQFGAHAVDTIASVGRKVAPSIFGSDDKPEYRKERIPEKERRQFVELFTDVPGGKEAIAEVGSSGSGEGIQAMVKHLRARIKEGTLIPTKLEGMRHFLEQLEKEYDHVDLRFGREVVFVESELDSETLVLPSD